MRRLFYMLYLIVNISEAVACAVFRKIESLKSFVASVNTVASNNVMNFDGLEGVILKGHIDFRIVLLLRVYGHAAEVVVNKSYILLAAIILVIRIVKENVVKHTIADCDGASSQTDTETNVIVRLENAVVYHKSLVSQIIKV